MFRAAENFSRVLCCGVEGDNGNASDCALPVGCVTGIVIGLSHGCGLL
jgi:hypothetical protein